MAPIAKLAPVLTQAGLTVQSGPAICHEEPGLVSFVSHEKGLAPVSKGPWPRGAGWLPKFHLAQDASQTQAGITWNLGWFDIAQCLLQTDTRNLGWEICEQRAPAITCPKGKENCARVIQPIELLTAIVCSTVPY
ncbi:uncharacterized protein GJ701_006920 isoform 2-T4 [Geothlypis trichas]